MKDKHVALILAVTYIVLCTVSAILYSYWGGLPTRDYGYEKLEYQKVEVNVGSNGNFIIEFELKNTGSRDSSPIVDLRLNNVSYYDVEDYVTQNIIGATDIEPLEVRTFFIELDKEKWEENETIGILVETNCGNLYPYIDYPSSKNLGDPYPYTVQLPTSQS